MNSTGTVRRIDDLGRVVIPKEIRRTLRVKEGDPMEISLYKNTIVLNKYYEQPVCVVCRRFETGELRIGGQVICNNCCQEALAVIQGETHA